MFTNFFNEFPQTLYIFRENISKTTLSGCIYNNKVVVNCPNFIETQSLTFATESKKNNSRTKKAQEKEEVLRVGVGCVAECL